MGASGGLQRSGRLDPTLDGRGQRFGGTNPQRKFRACGARSCRDRIPPGQLELEVTETALVRDLNARCDAATAQELGVRIAMDDFGTGFSSPRTCAPFRSTRSRSTVPSSSRSMSTIRRPQSCARCSASAARCVFRCWRRASRRPPSSNFSKASFATRHRGLSAGRPGDIDGFRQTDPRARCGGGSSQHRAARAQSILHVKLILIARPLGTRVKQQILWRQNPRRRLRRRPPAFR